MRTTTVYCEENIKKKISVVKNIYENNLLEDVGARTKIRNNLRSLLNKITIHPCGESEYISPHLKKLLSTGEKQQNIRGKKKFMIFLEFENGKTTVLWPMFSQEKGYVLAYEIEGEEVVWHHPYLCGMMKSNQENDYEPPTHDF